MDTLRYSIVVPILNEVESLPQLHDEIVAVMETLGATYEVIFVDDGSDDGTADVLAELCAANPRMKTISFVRNFGKAAAYMAAFETVRGRFVVTMDADLQDDPVELRALVDKQEEGFDLVVGWKQQRLENEPHKALPSKLFNRLKSLLFGLRLHDSNCGFRLMRVEVARSLSLQGDMYRFIPELAHQTGFTVAEAPVAHRKRKYGVSKYGPYRFWTGLLDLLTARFIMRYRERPLHFFGTAALLPTGLGVGLGVYVLIMKFGLGSNFQTHVAAVITSVSLTLGGFQLLMTGLIGEMISAQRQGKTWIIDRSKSQKLPQTKAVLSESQKVETTSRSEGVPRAAPQAAVHE